MLNYTNLVSPNDYEKKYITKIFSITKKIKKLYSVICSMYRKFKKSKISYLLQKTLVLSIISSKRKNEVENLFKEKESIEILQIFGLTENI